MMLKLYSDGSISSLDEPLTNYEPAFSVKNPFNADRITLRYLTFVCLLPCLLINMIFRIAIIENANSESFLKNLAMQLTTV